MAIASLSPNSVLASPIQVNPQVKTDLQTLVSQVAQDARKGAKTTQTDTVTISPQALNKVDDKSLSAKGTTVKNEDGRKALQLARDNADTVKNETQRNVLKAYGSVSTIQ